MALMCKYLIKLFTGIGILCLTRPIIGSAASKTSAQDLVKIKTQNPKSKIATSKNWPEVVKILQRLKLEHPSSLNHDEKTFVESIVERVIQKLVLNKSHVEGAQDPNEIQFFAFGENHGGFPSLIKRGETLTLLFNLWTLLEKKIVLFVEKGAIEIFNDIDINRDTIDY